MSNPIATYGLFIGALLILGSITMTRRGEGRLRFTTIRVRRSERPIMFWASVALMGALGVAIVVVATQNSN
jgi:hypothetical protein